MARVVSIGRQDFEKIRTRDNFYIDKTDLIREWWEADDEVTLLTRPRRFGKTLNMSMLEKFFFVNYADRSDLFQGLSIWEEKDSDGDYKYRKLQGTYPVLFISFAGIKERSYAGARENDTPMQEAYVNGYWDDIVGFIRSLFNYTFKTNPYLERAIMTGITRVSKESIFSDLNNLEVVTTTSAKYTDCFGFTEEEVFTALEEFGLYDKRKQVKDWYDGFWEEKRYLQSMIYYGFAFCSKNVLIGSALQNNGGTA